MLKYSPTIYPKYNFALCFRKNTESIFASAEEFAHLLEEDAEQGQVSLGGDDDVSNKDKSGEILTFEPRSRGVRFGLQLGQIDINGTNLGFFNTEVSGLNCDKLDLVLSGQCLFYSIKVVCSVYVPFR